MGHHSHVRGREPRHDLEHWTEKFMNTSVVNLLFIFLFTLFISYLAGITKATTNSFNL